MQGTLWPCLLVFSTHHEDVCMRIDYNTAVVPYFLVVFMSYLGLAWLTCVEDLLPREAHGQERRLVHGRPQRRRRQPGRRNLRHDLRTAVSCTDDGNPLPLEVLGAPVLAAVDLGAPEGFRPGQARPHRRGVGTRGCPKDKEEAEGEKIKVRGIKQAGVVGDGGGRFGSTGRTPS